jgi:hypothetical protein
VVSSADRRRLRVLVSPLAAVTLGATVSGCVSTQQKAGWAHIEAARIIASQGPTLVRRAGDELRVTRVTLLHDGARLAIAVGLRNVTRHALNDVPISVGLGTPGSTRVYLNRAAGLDYFKAHVAEVPARGGLTWVFTGRRSRHTRGLGGRPFAVVGDETAAPTTVRRALPRIRAALAAGSSGAGDGELRVTVTNLSSVPQPELQVYAIAGGTRGYEAAGSTTVADLESGSSTTTSLGLIGRLGNAQVRLEALPTLFQ